MAQEDFSAIISREKFQILRTVRMLVGSGLILCFYCEGSET
jgi:hypothetical protein